MNIDGLITQNKPTAALIVGDKSPADEGDVALESAAEEILAAVEAKDPKGLIDALKSFMELCEPGSDEAEPEKAPEA